PDAQGQPRQALGNRHAGPGRQADRDRGDRSPDGRSLLVERQLPSFPFSKPVSAGLIREIAFENSYREPRTREITRSRPKVLWLIDYHRNRHGCPQRRSMSACYGKPMMTATATERSALGLSHRGGGEVNTFGVSAPKVRRRHILFFPAFLSKSGRR